MPVFMVGEIHTFIVLFVANKSRKHQVTCVIATNLFENDIVRRVAEVVC